MINKAITNRGSIYLLIVFLGTFLNCSKLFAQDIDPTYISISEGLVSPVVQDVIQDNYGLIWIATTNGLQNFDGYRFETFKNNPQKPNSLLNNSIWGITEDSAHNIWVATDQGISRYNRFSKTFTNYDIKKQFNLHGNEGIVFKISIDSENRIWASTLSCELLEYNKLTDQWNHAKYKLMDTTRQVVTTGRVLGFTEDKQGGLWLGSSTYGLMHRDKMSKAFKPIQNQQTDHLKWTAPTNYITCLFADSAGVIWITTRNGIYKYFPTSGRIETIQEYNYNQTDTWNNWNCIRSDRDGNIWIANNFRGILKFDGISDHFKEIHVSGVFKLKDLGWNLVLSNFMIDKTGIFWFGNRSQGLMKYDPEKKPFTLYSHNATNKLSISNNGIYGMMESKVNPGMLYVGTKGGGLNIFDQKMQTFRMITYHAKNDLYGGSVRSISEDDDGSLWLGT